MKWINAFLCYRQQRVVVNGVKSDWVPVVSGVPQGTVLGPLLFSLDINDITADIESEIRLFADDCVCYREIKDKEDTLKLQRDIDRLGNWARKWSMRFQPVKCNMMQLTNKKLNKIQASYTLKGTVLENVDNIKCKYMTNQDASSDQFSLSAWKKLVLWCVFCVCFFVFFLCLFFCSLIYRKSEDTIFPIITLSVTTETSG